MFDSVETCGRGVKVISDPVLFSTNGSIFSLQITPLDAENFFVYKASNLYSLYPLIKPMKMHLDALWSNLSLLGATVAQ